MDFRFSAEDEAFRQEVLDFLEAEMPKDWAQTPEGTAEDGATNAARWEFTRRFAESLGERGWRTLGWPKEHGGAEAGPMRQALFNETMAYYRAPIYDQGIDRVGPTFMLHGTEEQREFFLPKIRDAEIVWCQGFSEPGSGSDLASLQCRAVRDGDDYIINGQKIWTSGAHHADYIFFLARTDPDAPKHRGISFFVADMKSPGISVRPLVNMADRAHFNETYFEDVRVPAKWRVGEENRGWYVATTTLDFERSGVGRVVAGVRLLEDMTALAKAPLPADHAMAGRRLADSASVRHKLAELHIEFAAGRLMAYRVAYMQSQGEIPNYEASMSKAYGGELNQRLAQQINLFGLAGSLTEGQPYAPLGGRLPLEYLNAIPLTIAAGTTEINKNIIATRGLGLPRG